MDFDVEIEKMKAQTFLLVEKSKSMLDAHGKPLVERLRPAFITRYSHFLNDLSSFSWHHTKSSIFRLHSFEINFQRHFSNTILSLVCKRAQFHHQSIKFYQKLTPFLIWPFVSFCSLPPAAKRPRVEPASSRLYTSKIMLYEDFINHVPVALLWAPGL